MWCGLANTRIALLVAGFVPRLGMPRVLGMQQAFVDGFGAVRNHVVEVRELALNLFKDLGFFT